MSYCVDPELGARSVRRPANRLQLERDEAPVCDCDLELRRLGHDRTVRRATRRDGRRPDARRLLVCNRSDDDVARKPAGRCVPSGYEDRCEASLHVVGAPSVEPPVLDRRLERPFHPTQPDRVHVRVQHECPPPARTSRHADHVRPSRCRLLDLHREPGVLEPALHVPRHLYLPGRARHEHRVLGVDGDQIGEERGQLFRHRPKRRIERWTFSS